jgi:hypothetical protein
LIKYDDTTTNLDYQFTTAAHYSAIILNQNPKFFNINLNRLNIDETSGAFKKNSTYLIPLDILGNTLPPDLGAYQNKSFPK